MLFTGINTSKQIFVSVTLIAVNRGMQDIAPKIDTRFQERFPIHVLRSIIEMRLCLRHKLDTLEKFN